MTTQPTPPTPQVVSVMEHTVYDAVCTRCPWTSEGHDQREWADHLADNHSKTHQQEA